MWNGCSALRAAHRRLTSSTEIEGETHAILARNPFNVEYGSRVAFADLSGQQISWTADRTEFLGRNGTLDNPAALASGKPLAARSGAAMDPCAALQTTLSLRPDAETEVVFFLGESATRAEAHRLDQEISRGRPRLDAGRGHPILGQLAWRDPGQDSRPLDGPHAQSMAAVSGAGVPRVGAIGLLPGGWRVRLSRSAAGRDGAGDGAACADARASDSRGLAPVHRRRRATLVAAAGGAGSPHAHHRRSRAGSRMRSPIMSR